MGLFSKLFKRRRLKGKTLPSAHQLEKDLKKINDDYCLGLSNDDLKMVFESTDPLSFVASKTHPGIPTVADYCLCMETTLNRIMDEINLSETDKNTIYFDFLSGLSLVTDELIGKIAAAFTSNVPPHLYFLKDKINYELASLGFIMQYGIDTGRKDICAKITMLRKKRGYI